MSPEQINFWVESYLNEILHAPKMWGSLEAVEMQVLLLLEFRLFGETGDSSRRVINSWKSFLSSEFEGSQRPLWQCVENEEEFISIMRKFLGRVNCE